MSFFWVFSIALRVTWCGGKFCWGDLLCTYPSVPCGARRRKICTYIRESAHILSGTSRLWRKFCV